MILHTFSLQNFRSFKEKKIIFSPQATLIIGNNAIGKTNLLEAIYLLATGKSFHAQKDIEMISYETEIARINGGTTTDLNLSIVLANNSQLVPSFKKIFQVNGVNKRWRDFAGNLKCVLFRPEDIDLVLGSPSLRRHYLDSVLEQVDWQYRVCNLAYQKGIRQRNKLLDKIRDGLAQQTQLLFWNQLLSKNGEIISQKREAFINFINDFLASDTKMKSIHHFVNLAIFYDKSVISQERLEKYLEAEIATGSTLVGPHRDDIKFEIRNSPALGFALVRPGKFETNRDLSLYGSRGEQRMAVLALKLAELAFITKKSGERPILLLDDIFSELDDQHRKDVYDLIFDQQTILTTTDEQLIPPKFYAKMKIVKLES